MPKLRLQIVNNQILADVFVFKREDEGNANPQRVKALFDTGAMNSCVTFDLAKKLALLPTSKILIAGVHGVKDCNVHVIKIGIPFPSPDDKLRVEYKNEIEVYEIDDNPAWQMIVGMDIIQDGILIVDGDCCVFSL